LVSLQFGTNPPSFYSHGLRTGTAYFAAVLFADVGEALVGLSHIGVQGSGFNTHKHNKENK